jgi:membrane protein required for colicin V production
MNSIDIAVITICILSTLVGFVRGFIASVFSTAGWILAIVGNHYLFDYIEPFLDAKFQSKILTFLIGYVGGLVLLLFCFAIINFLLLAAISTFRTGLIDRFLGSCFGFIRGALLSVIVFLCFDIGMGALSGEKVKSSALPDVLIEAKTLPWMKRGEMILMDHLPETFKIKLTLSNKSDEKIQDITLLNIFRKLSTNVSQDELEKINNEIEKNEKYVSKRQVLIAKIKQLWKSYGKNSSEKLSPDEIEIIKSIMSS